MEYKITSKYDKETKRYFGYGKFGREEIVPIIVRTYIPKDFFKNGKTRPEEIEVIIKIPEL